MSLIFLEIASKERKHDSSISEKFAISLKIEDTLQDRKPHDILENCQNPQKLQVVA
jgi:hypothetical protein